MSDKTNRKSKLAACLLSVFLISAFPWATGQSPDLDERIRKLEQDNAVTRQYSQDMQSAKLRDRTTALESTMEMSKWLLVTLNALAAGMGIYLVSSMRRVHKTLIVGQELRKEVKSLQDQIGALPCMRGGQTVAEQESL